MINPLSPFCLLYIFSPGCTDNVHVDGDIQFVGGDS